jgi:arylsulfatase A-like enzyme
MVGTNTSPVIGTDFYPTILDACGLPPRPCQHLDGISLMPALMGKKLPSRPLFWHYPHYSNQGGEPVSIIIDGEWKLIEDLEEGSLRLYNISKDIGEQQEISQQHPNIVKALDIKLQAWKRETGARPMEKNPNFDSQKFAAEMEINHTKRKASLEAFHKRLLNPTKDLPSDQPVTYRSNAFQAK